MFYYVAKTSDELLSNFFFQQPLEIENTKLKQKISLLKCNIEWAKQKEARAKAELEKILKKQLRETSVDVQKEDIEALVKKHGGASKKDTKKIAPTECEVDRKKPAIIKSKKIALPKESDDEDDEDHDEVPAKQTNKSAATKISSKRSTSPEESDEEEHDDAPAKKTNKSVATKATYQRVSSPRAAKTKTWKQKTRALRHHDTDSSSSSDDSEEDSEGKGSNTESGDISLPPLDVNTTVEVPAVEIATCNHGTCLGWMSVELPSYCEEGERFCSAKCMKCNSVYGDSLKPSSKHPLHHCPFFKDKCDAVLCDACFKVAIVADDDPQKTRRSSRRH